MSEYKIIFIKYQIYFFEKDYKMSSGGKKSDVRTPTYEEIMIVLDYPNKRNKTKTLQ
jgi:hypothetical protein